MMTKISGVFILDKPEGLSSNQALQKAKRLFQADKAGHTGSLDVLATGLLPICFGEATKFSQFVLDADKAYRVTAKLGEKTTTGDAEGEVIESHPVAISEALLVQTLKAFLGESEQTPPMYSALKHKGQPLYKLARKGETVERKPRKIIIHEIRLLDFQGDRFSVEVLCSKGTYIRTLIEDIGNELACGAHVTSLRRLKAGPYDAEQMLTLEKLETIREQGGVEALHERLLPTHSLLSGLPAIQLDDAQLNRLRHGQRLSSSDHTLGANELAIAFVGDYCAGLVCTNAEGVMKAKRLLYAA